MLNPTSLSLCLDAQNRVVSICCLLLFQCCVLYCIYLLCYEKCDQPQDMLLSSFSLMDNDSPSSHAAHSLESESTSEPYICRDLKQIKLIFLIITSSGYLCSWILILFKSFNVTKYNTYTSVNWSSLFCFLVSIDYLWQLSVLTLVLYIVFVALGAPILSSIEETLYCVCTISTLAKQPFLYVHRKSIVERTNMGRLEAFNLIILFPIATLFGGWLGAIFQPLDWGTKWQIYPFPIILGSLLTFTVGTFCILCRLFLCAVYKQ